MPQQFSTNIGLRQSIVLNRTLSILVMEPVIVSRNVILKYAQEAITRAFISSSYIREEFPILSLSWWGWRSCYESVVLGAPFTPAASTAEAERRVSHSISCDITL